MENIIRLTHFKKVTYSQGHDNRFGQANPAPTVDNVIGRFSFNTSLHDSDHEFLYCFFQSVQSQFSGLPPQLFSFS